MGGCGQGASVSGLQIREEGAPILPSYLPPQGYAIGFGVRLLGSPARFICKEESRGMVGRSLEYSVSE